MTKKRVNNRVRVLLAASASLAVTAMRQAESRAGTTGNLVTISLSGSTAMRAFTTSAGFSYLTPGTTITLNSGVGGATQTFSAPNTPGTQFQLAAAAFPATGGDVDALRIEWHEQGSVEGIAELVNDQLATISGLPNRDPSTPNPVWVNRVRFLAPGSANGFSIGTFGSGTSQSSVQMAISDVHTKQGFSIAGTGTYSATPTSTGYGKGNALLSSTTNGLGLGLANSRQSLFDSGSLNMSTDRVDPATGVNYTSGPWNTGGFDNTDDHVVAVTASLFVANPGTGLTHINRTDAQWLQTTGRLQNGADFNVAQRDVNSGTRNVVANNTGVDPSWAVAENDGGDNSAATQNSIGSGIKFSGKTAGSAVRTVVQNSRMSIGPLSMSDAIGSVQGSASTTPLRALDYSDSATDGSFVRASASSITDGSYVIWQQETYVTVKNNNSAAAATIAAGADPTTDWHNATDDGRNSTTSVGIKGDNSGNDVADVRNNILSSVKNFPASMSVANPADQLLSSSFILPQMVWQKKDLDGVGVQTAKSANINTDAADYDHNLRNALLGSSYANNFAPDDPSTKTAGASGAIYNGASGGTTFSGNINITDAGSGHGNWMFGNFKQNGVRDFSAVKAAVSAQAALFASGAGVDANSGSANNTTIAGLAAPLSGMTGYNGTAGAKKGDLIVMGDYNGDGKFDGKDLYQLAHGASLADSTSTDTLTTASGATFADQVRNGVLRKNAALDYMQTNATAQQRIDASANLANDPTGANAFNKLDVNRDGRVNRIDAQVVDHFIGTDYRSINDQLGAVIATNGTILDGFDANGIPTAETGKIISLVDPELDDTGNIDLADFALIKNDVGSGLLAGDANFDGMVDLRDMMLLAPHWLGSADRWSNGDFDLNGTVDAHDLGLLAQNWQASSGSIGLALSEVGLPTSLVPEPGSLSLISAAMLLMRRRRRNS
ncbi:MAG TPA: dockerin type I domain-containing protein [Tepidisphaeraceae bacterium]|nr:dockerin type I domain-containing protein [Tepidisphaeraceae bacterium]